MIMDIETHNIELFEETIDPALSSYDSGFGDRVFPQPNVQIQVGDGYDIADFVLNITIADDRERKLVLMATRLDEEGDREPVDDVEDEAALSRARKYAATMNNGAYYGVTDGEEVVIKSIDPDVKINIKTDFSDEALVSAVEEVVSEENRIKDSEEFIDKLRGFHESLTDYVSTELREKLQDDEFEEQIKDFLSPIGQDYEDDIPAETFDMLSQQAAYLLIDKVLFYEILKENKEELSESLDDEKGEVFQELEAPLPDMEGDEEVWAKEFWGALESKFSLIVEEIDYQPIFDEEKSPLNSISFESAPMACMELQKLINELHNTSDLANLFDGPLLAKIYEDLIPPKERWKWGQIYTPPEVTRLISKWSITHKDENVLDPACGTGRFLVSAYERLNELDPAKEHQEVIEQIHGVDINQFPAHLATMSLVSMNLTEITNHVNIKIGDFFNAKKGTIQYRLGDKGEPISPQDEEDEETVTTKKEDNRAYQIPVVDAITMNPPYTRHQALEENYKSYIREVSLAKSSGQIKMNKYAGLYSYFLTQGTKFLKDGGRFGSIIQNSWLDVDYGKDLQRFLLNNYRVRAIIGTKNDRMIKTAKVNTVILLLEKELSAEKRRDNQVKFVQLRNSVEWFEKNYGFDSLLDIIEEKEDYVGEDIRIISKKQSNLSEDSKWNKFLRAPDVYFDVIDKDNMEEISSYVRVLSGTKTGANEFFYFPNKHHEITEEDGHYAISNGRTFELSEENIGFILKDLPSNPRLSIEKDSLDVPNHLKYLFLADEDSDKLDVAEYIEWGEEHDPTTCENCSGKRKKKLLESPPWVSESNLWFNAKENLVSADMILRENIDTRFIATLLPETYYIDWTFYGVKFEQVENSEINRKVFAGLLNSTFAYLMMELAGRTNYGEGALQIRVYEYEDIELPDLRKISPKIKEDIVEKVEKIEKREIGGVFEEVGAETPGDVSLDDVRDDRRDLDQIVMGELLDLSRREQLEVYRGIIELVRDRIEKADNE